MRLTELAWTWPRSQNLGAGNKWLLPATEILWLFVIQQKLTNNITCHIVLLKIKYLQKVFKYQMRSSYINCLPFVSDVWPPISMFSICCSWLLTAHLVSTLWFVSKGTNLPAWPLTATDIYLAHHHVPKAWLWLTQAWLPATSELCHSTLLDPKQEQFCSER